MNKNFLGIICGGFLISLPGMSLPGLAQESLAKVNPCPHIFYEEPHNHQVLVPQGCPPNALTQKLMEQGLLPVGSVPATPSPSQAKLGVGGEAPSATNANPSILNEPPYNRSATEPQPTPSTVIALTDGRVNVKLVNDTGADVTYQVIGDTSERSLQGKTDATLQNLNTPVTVTFQRNDGGLLMVTLEPTSPSGVLEVRLKETTDVNQDRKALQIQSNGAVFLN
jgi:hypothetical protein